MTVISVSAVLFSREDDTLNSLSIAIIIMVLLNPFIIRNPSFLLSVSGFFGIGVFAPYMTKNIKSETWYRKIFKSFISMICLSIIVIPVSSLFFDETSVISSIVNVMLMPVCSLVLVLGLIVFATGGVGFIAYPLLAIASLICKLIISIAEYTASLSFASIPLGYDYISLLLIIALLYVGVTFAVFKSRNSVTVSILISVVMLTGSTVLYQKTSKNILTLSLFSNNNKTCALIVRQNNSVDIIDITASKKNDDYVKTYMQRYGINQVNNIILTQKPYRGVTNYNDKLKWYDIKNVFIPYGTYVLKNSLVCGQIPKYYDENNIVVEYENYSIEVNNQNSEIYIYYHDAFIKCGENISVYLGKDEYALDNVGDFVSIKTDGISRLEIRR